MNYSLFAVLIQAGCLLFSVHVEAQGGREACGVHAFAVCASYHGVETDFQELSARLLRPGVFGTNFLELQKVAEAHGFKAAGYKARPDQLPELDLPAIALVGGDHFVALLAFDEESRQICLWDSDGGGIAWKTIEEFTSVWQGEVLTLTPRRRLEREATLWLPRDLVWLGDFGSVKENVRVITVFNPGDKSLGLKSYRVSCGCTGVEFDPAVIPPGGFGRIKLQIDTSEKERGGFTVDILLQTDSPASGWTRIKLSGIVGKPIGLHPTSFHLGEVSSTASKIELRSVGALEGEMSLDRVSSEAVQVDEIIKDPSGQISVHFSVDVEKVATDSAGLFREAIRLHVDDPLSPFITMHIDGVVRSAMRSFPPSVYVSAKADMIDEINRRIQIDVNGGIKGSLLVSTSSSYIRALLDSEEPSMVDLSFSGSIDPGLYVENLIIDHESGSLKIPVILLVQR